MQIRIRTKLIFAISLLMMLLLSMAAYLFIDEKRKELTDDTFLNTLSFARLTAEDVAYNYDLYLAQNSFVYFNRGMQSVFEKNDDVRAIQLISYAGEVLYDSDLDTEKRYEGEPRMVTDTQLLNQVQSEFISVRSELGRTVYLEGAGIDLKYLDRLGQQIAEIESGTLLDYFVAPGNEKYSVVYHLDYTNLEQRLDILMQRIVLLAIFGIMLAILMSILLSGQLTRPISKLKDGADKIAQGDFKTRVEIKTSDEIGFLGKAFNSMARDLEKSVEARVYQEKLSRELELAASIQQQLVPKEIPAYEDLDIAPALLPAGAIGGDIYDFLPMGPERLMMYLGDVTGHGVPAGIVSSIANALFYGFAELGDLAKVIVSVNRVFAAKTMPNMFMTLCLMDWNVSSKQFTYVSAGHEQLVHYKAAEQTTVLAPAGGIAIGMIKDVSKVVRAVQLDVKPGDFIICYSDGVPEAWRNEKEQYGMERFQSVVVNYARNTAEPTSEGMKQAVLQDLKSFTAGYEQMDDVTLMVIKRR